MIKTRYITFLLLFILTFIVSYFRDTLFILLNAAINHDDNNYANSAVPDFFKQSSKTLLTLKWILSIAFSFVSMLLTVVAIHLFFKRKSYNQLILFFYVLLGVLTLLCNVLLHYYKNEAFFDFLILPETVLRSPLILPLAFCIFIIHNRSHQHPQ